MNWVFNADNFDVCTLKYITCKYILLLKETKRYIQSFLFLHPKYWRFSSIIQSMPDVESSNINDNYYQNSWRFGETHISANIFQRVGSCGYIGAFGCGASAVCVGGERVGLAAVIASKEREPRGVVYIRERVQQHAHLCSCVARGFLVDELWYIV